MENQKGYTFIEILITVSLFVILVFGMFQFSIISTNFSKKTQAEISLNQILYNIKTAITSSAARQYTLALSANAHLRKCADVTQFHGETCKALAAETVAPYAKGLVLLDASQQEIARGDSEALATVATKYDEYGTKCPSSPSATGACPIYAQAFYKTLCLDPAQNCGSINDVVIMIHYRILFDPSLPSSSPYKMISPNLISSLKNGKLNESGNAKPQMPLLTPAGYFNF